MQKMRLNPCKLKLRQGKQCILFRNVQFMTLYLQLMLQQGLTAVVGLACLSTAGSLSYNIKCKPVFCEHGYCIENLLQLPPKPRGKQNRQGVRAFLSLLLFKCQCFMWLFIK